MQKNLDHQKWKAEIWKGFDEKARKNEEPFIKAVQKISKRQKSDIEKLIKNLEN